MKSNKMRVFEYIKEYSIREVTDEYPKLTTQFLSEKLEMQRSNLSSILNQLVKEEKIIKINTRPVLYQLVNFQLTNQGNFEDLIGYNQSLNEAVMLAKAAIIYPQGSPHILLTAESGCGVKYFAKKSYDFAIKSRVLKNNAPFIVFDCKSFIENPITINEILFGDTINFGLIHQSNHGLLLIKHVELLSGHQRTILFSIVSNNKINANQHIELPDNFKCIMICAIASGANHDIYDLYHNKMDFSIELSPLSDRPLKERFAFLELFLKKEAQKLDRIIKVSTNILHSLLLYVGKDNIHGLKNVIHTGVANCYAREHELAHQIELSLSDFPNHIRKGLIYYKVHKKEIDEIISNDYELSFTKNEILKNRIKKNYSTIYHVIDVRKRELKKQNISEDTINSLLSLQLQHDFQKYFKELNRRVNNIEQLAKIVSMKLINLVDEFINTTNIELNLENHENVLYALCLHINSSLIRIRDKQRLANEEIKKMIEFYPKCYTLAKDFIKRIEQEFNVSMNIDEIIFTMLFIIEDSKQIRDTSVVTLIAMHGKGSASSIVEVVNELANMRNTYAYDLPLSKNMDRAYEDLKKMILKINQGKGIVFIYDMGSIRTMAESISFETGIDIKCLEMPITLMGIASSNKANDGYSIDEVYGYLQDKFKDIKYFRKQGNKKILVLMIEDFETGTKAKEFLDKNFDITNISVRTIENSEPDYLYTEINEIVNEGEIVGIIGDSKPNLAQFPYISTKQLFQSKESIIYALFDDKETNDIDEIFEYLKDQFNEVDVDGIREYLLVFVNHLKTTLDTDLDEDQQIGLIAHLICLFDRIIKCQPPVVNFLASKIILHHRKLVKSVKELLEPLETLLNIKISDAEIATIISIVKKR